MRVQAALDDDHIQPAPVELGVLLVHANFAKAAGAAKSKTRGIGREHPGYQLPVAARAQLAKVCALGGAALMVVVCWQAILVAELTWDEMMQSVDLSTNWFMVPVAVAAAHSVLHLIQLLWRAPLRTARPPE